MPNSNPPAIAINIDIAEKINFACHQSAFPVLQSIYITNSCPNTRFDDLTLTLKSNPSFITDKQWVVDRMESGSIPIQHRDIKLDAEFLRGLTESCKGEVVLQLTKKDGEVLAKTEQRVELLAYNEWGGTEFMPELLAAFSMPNDLAVDKIIRSAVEILRKAGKNDRIDGYASNSREHVWEIASAIYAAVANLGLAYAAPPASFESNGQKIRLPGQIYENRVGTCLDIAMLLVSVFEQAGLNPIIALPKEHALAGVWLQPEKFSNITMDEAEILRKQVALKELILIESTFLTLPSPPKFSKALESAMKCVQFEHDDTFVAAIDICRARAHSIMPLGAQQAPPSQDETDDTSATTVEHVFENAPALPTFDHDSDDAVDEMHQTPEGRLERWQKKLLDLTLHNRLLNHSATKTSLELICPKPSKLEDKLASGKKIEITSVPESIAGRQDEEVQQQRTGEIIATEYALDELENNNRILVDLPREELFRRTTEIYRKTETSLQESGSNTLYLALGFLRWKRSDADKRRLEAPLILLPVKLLRPSVRSKVKIAAHDDEPRFNTTLLEMLRIDFDTSIPDLEGDLPTDDSGIDVDKIWATVRRAIESIPGFEVIEKVSLGHFVFAKYLMWKDLVDRTDALRENLVVRQLLDPNNDKHAPEISFISPQDLDQEFEPADLLTPLPTDSSQMAAVAAAHRGKNFIIIGPPGTGKSQTIANIIAHALGTNKTVLFVSEKTAALEAVYRRLESVNLEQFCLELHSNKAQKADVLKQLRKAWVQVDKRIEINWEERAAHLLKLRNKLNSIIKNLHQPHRNGLTVHHAIGIKIRDESYSKHIKLHWPSASHHDHTSLNNMRECVKNLSIQAKNFAGMSSTPFGSITNPEWKPSWEEEICAQAFKISSAVRNVAVECRNFCSVTDLDVCDLLMPRVNSLAKLAKLFVDAYQKQVAYALEPGGLELIDALKEATTSLENYARAREQLSCTYAQFAWRNLDGNVIGQRWAAANSSLGPIRWFKHRSIKKEIRANGAEGSPNPGQDAIPLSQLRIEGEKIDRLSERLSNFKTWSDHTTDPSTVGTLGQLGLLARAVVYELANDPDPQIQEAVRNKIRTLLGEHNDLLGPESNIGRAATTFLTALQDLHSACDEFASISFAVAPKAPDNERWLLSSHSLTQIQEVADTIVERRQEIRNWCAWLKRKSEAIDANLLPVVKAIEDNLVSADDLEMAFEAAYCSWWSTAIIEENALLRNFFSSEHNASIKEFRKADIEFQQITARYIEATLVKNQPNTSDKLDSDWRIVSREMEKKRRHKPVRQLLRDAPKVLTTLTPCFMMSPLSVAQYLSAKHALFDIVVFDEASQITTWDAIGSIARAQQVVVAGDPMQMPPSNFFARSDDDPSENISVEGDLESILGEMRSVGIPEHNLKLHYRSQKEGLITFSNSRYYDNSLVTFPAPTTTDSGIRLVRPKGAFYARGGARINQEEAKEVVSEVIRRLKDLTPANPGPSIGVVTFNSEQQMLIEDLLDKERGKHKSIEWAFSREETPEPVFVKNLETVQGDERDIILFSTTYGPDLNGHMTMNFGPLNREGGERRLNVALTRARQEMLVFSTLDTDMLDIRRTKARAVKDLKDFLQYARDGLPALAAATPGSVGDFESPFEAAVARELRQKGWDVSPQVGASSYRIDLGIIHPDKPGRYLAGVESDGAMYHSSAFARERDRIRQLALTNLGWKLLRIWSIDWWNNKAKEVERIDKNLRQLLEEDQQANK